MAGMLLDGSRFGRFGSFSDWMERRLAQTEVGRISQIKKYLTDVRTEVGKVVWPTRKETTSTTLVVFGMVFFVSLFLWLVDAILALIVRTIIG